MRNLDDSAKNVLKKSRSVARQRGATTADTIDIFIAAIKTSADVQNAIASLGVDWRHIVDVGAAEPPTGRRTWLRRPVSFTLEARTLLLQASTLVADETDLSASHLFAAALKQDDERITELLRACDVDPQELMRAMAN